MTIAEYRKKYGLTQDDLAQRVPVSRGALAQWELGLTLPSTENLMALIDASNGEITLEGVMSVKAAA